MISMNKRLMLFREMKIIFKLNNYWRNKSINLKLLSKLISNCKRKQKRGRNLKIY